MSRTHQNLHARGPGAWGPQQKRNLIAQCPFVLLTFVTRHAISFWNQVYGMFVAFCLLLKTHGSN